MTTHVVDPIDLPAILEPSIVAALDEARWQAPRPYTEPTRWNAFSGTAWRPYSTPTTPHSFPRRPVGSGSAWSQACHFSNRQFQVRRYEERN
jgi:hypothetical protein